MCRIKKSVPLYDVNTGERRIDMKRKEREIERRKIDSVGEREERTGEIVSSEKCIRPNQDIQEWF